MGKSRNKGRNLNKAKKLMAKADKKILKVFGEGDEKVEVYKIDQHNYLPFVDFFENVLKKEYGTDDDAIKIEDNFKIEHAAELCNLFTSVNLDEFEYETILMILSRPSKNVASAIELTLDYIFNLDKYLTKEEKERIANTTEADLDHNLKVIKDTIGVEVNKDETMEIISTQRKNVKRDTEREELKKRLEELDRQEKEENNG